MKTADALQFWTEVFLAECATLKCDEAERAGVEGPRPNARRAQKIAVVPTARLRVRLILNHEVISFIGFSGAAVGSARFGRLVERARAHPLKSAPGGG